MPKQLLSGNAGRMSDQKLTGLSSITSEDNRCVTVKYYDDMPLLTLRFMLDHASSSLIWNYKTREELREALENEIRSFTVDKDLSGTTEISWNHVEFEVRYESLSEEIKIGDYYLRLLLDEKGETSFVKP